MKQLKKKKIQRVSSHGFGVKARSLGARKSLRGPRHGSALKTTSSSEAARASGFLINKSEKGLRSRTLRNEDASLLAEESTASGDEEDVSSLPLSRAAAGAHLQGTVSFLDDDDADTDAHDQLDSAARSAALVKKKVLTDTTFSEFATRLDSQADADDPSGAADADRVALDPVLVERLGREGFNVMTRIQCETIPRMLTGIDILLRSETGSGKTLAFLLPGLQLLVSLDRRTPLSRSMGTRVLLLAPTRELVSQTTALAARLMIPFPRVVVGSISGGNKRKSEKSQLRRGVTFLGATVGRICDHLDTTQSFAIHQLELLILDEADRLLDMGFEKKLRWIVNKIKEARIQRPLSQLWQGCEQGEDCSAARGPDILKKKKGRHTESGFQTVLVSATLTAMVKRLAHFVLRESSCAWIGNMAEETATMTEGDGGNEGSGESQDGRGAKQSIALRIPAHVRQLYTRVTLKTRLALLLALLCDKTRNHGKVVVFCSNCDSVELHHALFQTACWPGRAAFGSRVRLNDPHRRASVVPDSAAMLDERLLLDDDDEHCDNTNDGVFTGTGRDDKTRTERKKLELQQLLGDRIFPAATRFFKLHGNLTQADRLGFLKDFNQYNTSGAVLFTTDVAARGLNLEGVNFVIQCDPPQELEEYVHRVGRTGRLEKEGTALLFLLDHEEGYAEYLNGAGVQLAVRPELELFQPLLQEVLPSYIRSRRLQNCATYLTSFLTRQVEADIDLLHLARRAFSASYRAYRCYAKELKPYFNVKSLHLGHLATAFGLSESPSLIGEKCRQGAFAAATRQVLGKNQEAKTREERCTKSNNLNRPHGVNDKFSARGGGLLHDIRKAQVPQKIIKQSEKLRSTGGVRSNKPLKMRATENPAQTAALRKTAASSSFRVVGENKHLAPSDEAGQRYGSRKVNQLATKGLLSHKTADPVTAALAKLREMRDLHQSRSKRTVLS